MNIEIKAELDPSSMGTTRNHYVFPNDSPKSGYARANDSDITGGIYIRKGTVVPNSITIILSDEPPEEKDNEIVTEIKKRRRSKKSA